MEAEKTVIIARMVNPEPPPLEKTAQSMKIRESPTQETESPIIETMKKPTAAAAVVAVVNLVVLLIAVAVITDLITIVLATVITDPTIVQTIVLGAVAAAGVDLISRPASRR